MEIDLRPITNKTNKMWDKLSHNRLFICEEEAKYLLNGYSTELVEVKKLNDLSFRIYGISSSAGVRNPSTTVWSPDQSLP